MIFIDVLGKSTKMIKVPVAGDFFASKWYNENYYGGREVDKNYLGAGVFCFEMAKFWLINNDQILIPLECTKSEVSNHWFLQSYGFHPSIDFNTFPYFRSVIIIVVGY